MNKHEPYWKKDYDRLLSSRMKHAVELSYKFNSYPVVNIKESIVIGSINNIITLNDKESGDFFLLQTVDRERYLIDFRYFTRSHKFVAAFRTQFFFESNYKSNFTPIRLYDIIESSSDERVVRDARSRINPEIFSRFLALYVRPKKGESFVLVDAPLQEGEELR